MVSDGVIESVLQYIYPILYCMWLQELSLHSEIPDSGHSEIRSKDTP